MWFVFLKILLLCLYLINSVNSYQYSYTKTSHLNDKWKNVGGSTSTSSQRNLRQQTTISPYFNSNVHLRHNRFHNLDKVMNRLDHMTTSTPSYKNIKRRDEEKDDYDFMADDNYDDQEYDDEVEDDEDDWKTDKKEDEIEEEIEDINFDNGYQAEEATDPPRTLTKSKWDHYGTRSRVEESRQKQFSQLRTNYEDSPQNAAIQHYLRVKYHINCKNPHQKVISVQSEHPSPGKRYVPHCTLLHRCSEDTGCCMTHNTKCGPIKQTLIYLYFYTTGVNNNGTTVEKLPFYNHTECSCIEKTSNNSKIQTIINESSSRITRSGSSSEVSTLNKRCRCPEVYEPTYHFGCTCDCTEGEDDCDTMKKGFEYFSLKNRLCILSGDCGVPKCEYGIYLRSKGRCPRKQEKIRSYADVTE